MAEKYQWVLSKTRQSWKCCIHTISASMWDFSTAAPVPNHSHQSKGSLVQKTWPTEAKIYQHLAAVQSAFSVFSWAPASLQAGASPTGCSGRFIFMALLLYWMGLVKLKGWSTMLTLPGWWVQFAHGSSLLKIFASEVLHYEAFQVNAFTKWHIAPDYLLCVFLLFLLPLRLSSVFMLSEFHDPQAFETWLKTYFIILKMNGHWEKIRLFSPFLKSYFLYICGFITTVIRNWMYDCTVMLAATSIPIVNEIISVNYTKNENI